MGHHLNGRYHGIVACDTLNAAATDTDELAGLESFLSTISKRLNPNLTFRKTLLPILCSIALNLSGCGGSGEQSNFNPPPQPTPIVTPLPTVPPTPTVTPTITPTVTPTPTPTEIFVYGKDQSDFNMAFIVVGNDVAEMDMRHIAYVNYLKAGFPRAFNLATKGLATMDVSYQTVFMADGGKWRDHGNITNVVAEFFAMYQQDFDFVTCFPTTDTSVSMSSTMFHLNVKNEILGLGMPLYDNNSASYGCSRLKGINGIPFIFQGMYSTPDEAHRALLHETGHQWGINIGDNFGSPYRRLEIRQQNIHFYVGLQSHSGNRTPMGSDNWVPNGDGTYRRASVSNVVEFHPFQLYFMGLITDEDYDFNKKFMVFDAGAGDSGMPFNPYSAVPYREVCINDIVAVEGLRCRVIKVP